jgi:hypothetical protein
MNWLICKTISQMFRLEAMLSTKPQSRVKWNATSSDRVVAKNITNFRKTATARHNTMADYKTYLAANILTEDKVVCKYFMEE